MDSRIRRIRSAPMFACMVAALWLAGCATEDEATEAAAPDEPAAAESAGQPEVLFTNMEEGGTYPGSHEVIFAADLSAEEGRTVKLSEVKRPRP